MKIIFTEHIKERMEKRHISEEEILSALKYPDKVAKKGGKYIAEKNIGRAKIEVVYEKDRYINIVTVYYI